MKKFFASSADPQQVSLTIKGMFSLVVPIVALVLNHFGKHLDNDTLNQIQDAIVQVIIVGSSLISAAMILFGLVRKFYNALK